MAEAGAVGHVLVIVRKHGTQILLPGDPRMRLSPGVAIVWRAFMDVDAGTYTPMAQISHLVPIFSGHVFDKDGGFLFSGVYPYLSSVLVGITVLLFRPLLGKSINGKKKTL